MFLKSLWKKTKTNNYTILFSNYINHPLNSRIVLNYNEMLSLRVCIIITLRISLEMITSPACIPSTKADADTAFFVNIDFNFPFTCFDIYATKGHYIITVSIFKILVIL